MKLGFSGTQHGLTLLQIGDLRAELERLYDKGFRELHHGMCIGADLNAVKLARKIGYKIHAHPGDTPKKQHDRKLSDFVSKPQPNLVRNRRIVRQSSFMIFCPRTKEQILRSGTWATYRYAIKLGVPGIIICPDGTKKRLCL
jgi:hypothetical protein